MFIEFLNHRNEVVLVNTDYIIFAKQDEDRKDWTNLVMSNAGILTVNESLHKLLNGVLPVAKISEA